MVSIITPFYNAESHLEQSILSTLQQTEQDWELLLINDGSQDRSKEIALSFDDKRIRYFEQENQGVSSARNLGLANMVGEYFCSLDADDILTERSIQVRKNIFIENPNIEFVDGIVKIMDADLKKNTRIWVPNFHGHPLTELVTATEHCFFGPSWMIKRVPEKVYQFDENITHCEDLLFYLEITRGGGDYTFVNEPILKYRDTPGSAMKGLKGLEMGYRYTEMKIRGWAELDQKDIDIFMYKYKRAMFLAYLKEKQLINALKAII
ncbi:MAG: glycosyltransferase family 2 protein [Bacteroidota bacterium]